MKIEYEKLNATPEKRLILSIISDYDLYRSICELIDNAIDNWSKLQKANNLVIQLDFDLEQKTIFIRDNSGGVQPKDLRLLVSPGATSNSQNDSTIGIFGVGTKRAVIAVAQSVKITSRYKTQNTYLIEFDNKWVEEVDDWYLQCYQVDNIDVGCTIIELSKLRVPLDQNILLQLQDNLSMIYGRFIFQRGFSIYVNKALLNHKFFDNWAYPPNYAPKTYTGKIVTSNESTVDVEITAGLLNESSPSGGEYGVYLYCNDRLIVNGSKSPEFGFFKGVGGFPHPSISIMQIIVSLNGAAIDMPWNSSKSDISPNHPTFQAIRQFIFDTVKTYTSLSRRLENWEETVFQFTKGEIEKISVTDFQTPKKSYFLELPPTNVKYADVIKNRNAAVTKVNPWTRGLWESMIIVDVIMKQKKVETKNRSALILLDSNLEIALKEFLVNNVSTHYSDKELTKLFEKRHLVINEVRKFVDDKAISEAEWKKITYYYDLRSKLVHERATVEITDEQIADQREVVEKVLKKLVKLKF